MKENTAHLGKPSSIPTLVQEATFHVLKEVCKLNTKKFISVYLLLVLLTGALAFAPALTANAATSEAPKHVTVGEKSVMMLQFYVQNNWSDHAHIKSLDVSMTSDSDQNYNDVDKIIMHDWEGVIIRKSWDKSGESLTDFKELIEAGQSRGYRLYVDVAADATIGDSIDVKVYNLVPNPGNAYVSIRSGSSASSDTTVIVSKEGVDYMEKHEIEDPHAAIAGRSIEDESGSTQLTAQLIANFNVKPREADELFDEFGYSKVREAFESADGEYDAFLSSLGVSSI